MRPSPSPLAATGHRGQHQATSAVSRAHLLRIRELREAFVAMAANCRPRVQKLWRFKNAACPDRYSPTDAIAAAIDDCIQAGASLDDVLTLPRAIEAQVRARFAVAAPEFTEALLRESRVDAMADMIQAEALAHPNCPTTVQRTVATAEHLMRALADVAAAGRQKLGRLTAFGGRAA